MSPTNSQSGAEADRQALRVPSLPFHDTSSEKITLVDPRLLIDHSANVKLFGHQRLLELSDLVDSV
jgi:hypothetical protein